MGSKYRDYAVYTVRETSFMFVSLQDHVTEPSGSFNIAKPRDVNDKSFLSFSSRVYGVLKLVPPWSRPFCTQFRGTLHCCVLLILLGAYLQNKIKCSICSYQLNHSWLADIEIPVTTPLFTSHDVRQGGRDVFTSAATTSKCPPVAEPRTDSFFSEPADPATNAGGTASRAWPALHRKLFSVLSLPPSPPPLIDGGTVGQCSSFAARPTTTPYSIDCHVPLATKSLLCPVCLKSRFSTTTQLKTHARRVHQLPDVLTPSTCSKCERQFPSFQSAAHHYRRCHPSIKSTTEESKPPPDTKTFPTTPSSSTQETMQTHRSYHRYPHPPSPTTSRWIPKTLRHLPTPTRPATKT